MAALLFPVPTWEKKKLNSWVCLFVCFLFFSKTKCAGHLTRMCLFKFTYWIKIFNIVLLSSNWNTNDIYKVIISLNFWVGLMLLRKDLKKIVYHPVSLPLFCHMRIWQQDTILDIESEPLGDTRYANVLILAFPIPWRVRNNFLLFTNVPLCGILL